MNDIKFVIVAQERTGSTFLQMLLSSHSQVLNFGELFNPREEIRKKASKMFGPLASDGDPIEYLENHVYKKYPDKVRAVGFKLFYEHARKKEWAEVWPYLRSSGIKIIHLRRKNLLNRYLSHQLAYQSKQWIFLGGDQRPAYEPITINIKHCIEDLHKSVWYQQEVDNFFKDNPKIDILYEKLAKDTVEECRSVQEFLGLEIQTLSAPTVKQQRKRKSEIITNYNQLKDYFVLGVSKGWLKEEWLEFFEDDETFHRSKPILTK